MSTTTTAPVETVNFMTTGHATQDHIMQAMNKAMKKYSPLEDPGPPGGGPGRGPPGGGGGPPRGGGPPLGAGAQAPAIPTNNKTWGSLPNHFDRNRARADDFLEELRSYLHANRANTGLQLPITRVAIALTLIKGPEVQGWVKNMGEFLNNLDPTIDDVPEV